MVNVFDSKLGNTWCSTVANDSDQNSVVNSWVVWFFDDHTIGTVGWVGDGGSANK